MPPNDPHANKKGPRQFATAKEVLEYEMEKGGINGLYDPLDYALYVKDEFLRGIDPELKAEAANDFYLTAEAAKKPRTLGIAEFNETIGEGRWFNEMIIFRKPGGGFWHWWDPPEKNQPPEDRGAKLIEGKDYHKVELPLKKNQPVSAEFIAFIRERTGCSEEEGEEEARKFAWEKAADNYAQFTVYKIMRGDSEQWAGGFEPAVFLDQKPGGTMELATPDQHKLYLNTAKKQLEALAQKEDKLQAQDPPKELSGQDQQLREWLIEHIHRINDAEITRRHAEHLGDDWREKEVKSGFRSFSSAGRLIYSRIQPPIARALASSRRQQARLMRTIGIEVPDTGPANVDTIIYSRMSEAYDLNPPLTDAILTRSGLNVEPKDIETIKRRLNEWREMHGLLPIEVKPYVDRIGPQGQQQKTEEAGAAGKKQKQQQPAPAAQPGEPESDEDREKREKEEERQSKDREHSAEALMKKFPPPTKDRTTLGQWKREDDDDKKDAWVEYYHETKRWDLSDYELEDLLKQIERFWKNKKSSETYNSGGFTED